MKTVIEKQATYTTMVLKSKVLQNKCNTLQDIQDLYNEHREAFRESKENKDV